MQRACLCAIALFDRSLHKALGVPLLAMLWLLSVGPQVLVGCRPTEHFFDVTGELYVQSAADHYSEALDRAQEWQPGAYLSGISSIPARSSGAGHDAVLGYTFHSPSVPGEFMVLYYSEDVWSSEVVERDPALSLPLPIPNEDWLLDSVDAWSIALANGGEEFLLRHQDPLTNMGVSLDYWRIEADESVLAWRVDFLSLFTASLDMLIDPKTGDILEVEAK